MKKWTFISVLILSINQISWATCPPGEMPESGDCCPKCEARCEASGNNKDYCQRKFGKVEEHGDSNGHSLGTGKKGEQGKGL